MAGEEQGAIWVRESLRGIICPKKGQGSGWSNKVALDNMPASLTQPSEACWLSYGRGRHLANHWWGATGHNCGVVKLGMQQDSGVGARETWHVETTHVWLGVAKSYGPLDFAGCSNLGHYIKVSMSRQDIYTHCLSPYNLVLDFHPEYNDLIPTRSKVLGLISELLIGPSSIPRIASL